ncbi:MAG TPA: hypothetical protein VF063_10605 [Gaiellaceae bacterium]
MHDPQRREALLDHAIAVGKFPAHRRAYWSSRYDQNPAGTEAAITAMTAVGAAVLGHSTAATSTEPPAQAQHVNPVIPPRPAASADLNPDLNPDRVAGWSRELFPEAVAAGSKPKRIMSDQRYSRVHA